MEKNIFLTLFNFISYLKKLFLKPINTIFDLIKINLYNGFSFLLNEYIDYIIENNYDIIFDVKLQQHPIIFQSEIYIDGFKKDLEAKQYRIVGDILHKHKIDVDKKSNIFSMFLNLDNSGTQYATTETIDLVFSELVAIPNLIEIMDNNYGLSAARQGVANVLANKKN